MDGNHQRQTDAELVFQATQGHREAFERLVERYQEALLHMASRISPNPDAAQDLIQEALLKAYLSLGSLRDPFR